MRRCFKASKIPKQIEYNPTSNKNPFKTTVKGPNTDQKRRKILKIINLGIILNIIVELKGEPS